jgi:serine/threonine-protein kinase
VEVTPKKGFPSEGAGHPEASPRRGPLHSVAYDDDETLLAQSAPVPLPRGSSEDLMPGMMLGEYRVEGKIGEGGMSAVFAAVHPLIGKRAAIKILTPALCSDPRSVNRFIDEARAVNQIGHPNIVDVFAFGVLPDGRHYLVMELLQGETLGARMHRQRMTLAEACAVLKPLARALAVVHDKGITHRDLKPENVFLVSLPGEPPVIKLLDFGIAKLSWQEYGVERTAVGAMMGTPQYMAPEQARGHDVDGRADISAFGGILFEMHAGRPVFLADNTAEILAKHLVEDPPRLSTLVRVPADVDDLVAAMLAKDPGARPSLDRICEVLDRNLGEPSGVVAAAAIAALAALPTVRHELPAVAALPTVRRALPVVAAPRPPRAWRRVALLLALTSAVAVTALLVVRSLAPTVARRLGAGSGSEVGSAAVDPPTVANNRATGPDPTPAAASESKPGAGPDPKAAASPDPKAAAGPDPKAAAAAEPGASPDPKAPVVPKPAEPAQVSPGAPDPAPKLDAPPPAVEAKHRPARSGHLSLAIRGAANYFVIVDGKPEGMRSELALPAGRHEIEVQAAGVAPQRFSVQIEAGKTRQREVKWAAAVKAPTAPTDDVELLPPGATVPRRPR